MEEVPRDALWAMGEAELDAHAAKRLDVRIGAELAGEFVTGAIGLFRGLAQKG